MKWLASIVIVILLCCGSFFAGKISVGLENGLFPPTYASDSKVVNFITRSGFTIPPSARNLTYLCYGLPNSSEWISMEVPVSERELVQSTWLKMVKGTPEKIKESEVSNYNPALFDTKHRPFRNFDITRFDISDWKRPIGYWNADDTSQYAFIYDAESQRILLFSSGK